MRERETKEDRSDASRVGPGEVRGQPAGSESAAHPLERLHRAVGNQVIQAESTPEATHGSLAISDPEDPAEREAERVAERLIEPTVSEPSVTSRASTRGVAGRGRGPAAVGDGAFQTQELLGSGRPLSRVERSFFEPRFGRGLGDVRVHTGPDADRAARAIDAEAFTDGTDVVFREGAYDPARKTGWELLAHELTHVVQTGGRQHGEIRRSGDGDTGTSADASEAPTTMDYAKLSRAVYGSDPPEGWVKWNDYTDEESGFHAALYFHQASFEFVLAFEGTNMSIQEWEDMVDDWRNNVSQGTLGESAQYFEAMKLAEKLADWSPYRITFVGHSLGGGLASAAATVTGSPAVTFNAAGLNRSTIEEYLRGRDSPTDVDELVSSADVRAYYVEGEILSTVQDWTPMPEALGERIALDPTGWTEVLKWAPWPTANVGYRAAMHRISAVIEAMQ